MSYNSPEELKQFWAEPEPPAESLKVHISSTEALANDNVPTLSAESKAEMASGKGTKDDRGKVPLSLLPPEACFEIAKVFAFGAKKYSRDNYRGGMDFSRLQDANDRHWKKWQMGEDIDEESGFHHLAHAGCCTMMALVMVLNPKRYAPFDDRYKQLEMDI